MSDDDQTQAAERVGLMATNAALLRDLEDLCQQRDEARAQAVAATTEADDLRVRVAGIVNKAMHGHEDGYYDALFDVAEALDAQQRVGIAQRAANSAPVDPSATPDLLGPQIGAEPIRKFAQWVPRTHEQIRSDTAISQTFDRSSARSERSNDE